MRLLVLALLILATPANAAYSTLPARDSNYAVTYLPQSSLEKYPSRIRIFFAEPVEYVTEGAATEHEEYRKEDLRFDNMLIK